MKLRMLVAAAALATTGSAMAGSNVVHDGYEFNGKELIPAGMRLEVGTTGYGGAFIWTPSPKVDVVLGYNGGDISWSDDVKVNGAKYDWDQDNNNVYLNAQIRPWSNWFYMAAGVAYTDNDYDLKGKASGQDIITINGDKYKADGGVGTVKGKMRYEDEIAPYVGLGFSPAINNRWGVFGEIGAYYTGNPAVNLTATNLIPVDPATTEYQNAQDAADADARKIANDDKYEWMPVAKLGVSFRF